MKFWKKIASRIEIPTNKYRLNVCTDGNKQNKSALKKTFTKNSINYGKVKKVYSGAIVIGTIAKNVLGKIPKDEISIRHVDGFCKRLRERVSRYCRRSSTFSKKKTPFELHLAIFQAYNNFIEIYKDKKTPCMIEKITSKKWDWHDILMRFYQPSQ